MKTAKILVASSLSCMPNKQSGDPVIRIITDLPAGHNNSCYIECADIKGVSLNPVDLKAGDDITFDKQDAFNRAVLWNGRKFRQKGYSFDTYAPLH